jgi:hypothetical protein
MVPLHAEPIGPRPPTAHDNGYAAAEALAEEYEISLDDLRAFAAERLAEGYAARGITDGDIGTSDVSITLAQIALHEPDALREEAARLQERNDLVASISARTGRSEAETLANLQRLLATYDPPTVPLTGGRRSEYLMDSGEWVRCDVLTTNRQGLHSIELAFPATIGGYRYDVPPERIRWTT